MRAAEAVSRAAAESSRPRTRKASRGSASCAGHLPLLSRSVFGSRRDDAPPQRPDPQRYYTLEGRCKTTPGGHQCTTKTNSSPSVD